MSDHVRERLSAYLDRELAPADDAAVLSHLRGCEDCRRHLAALTLVDKAARALPVEAPAGYFDALPGRVRARLETTSAERAGAGGRARVSRPSVRRPLGLPAWTWAVAAALVLVVVTPLTLRERPPSSPTPPSAPPAVPAASAPPMTMTGGASDKLRQEATADLVGKAEPKAGYPARARVAEPEAGASAEAPASRVSTPPVPAAERRPPMQAPGGPYAQAPAQAQALSGQAAGNVAVGSPAEETAGEEAAPSLAKSTRERDEGSLRGEGTRAGRFPRADEQEFSRLAAPSAQTVGALRARREAWRTFVLLYPNSSRTDEARVRAIEAGIAAWRRGHDPVDLGQARVDAASYLARPDAVQAVRVRAMLAGLETTPAPE